MEFASYFSSLEIHCCLQYCGSPYAKDACFYSCMVKKIFSSFLYLDWEETFVPNYHFGSYWTVLYVESDQQMLGCERFCFEVRGLVLCAQKRIVNELEHLPELI
jgi:hypothetical protein